MRQRILLGALFFSALFFNGPVIAQQTGTCDMGTEYCEGNSLNTTNTTTTTNSNTNVNTNNNTNVNTNSNTNVNTTTSTATNSNTNVNTNNNTSSTTNVNTNNSTATNTNNNNNVNTVTTTGTQTNTNNNNNVSTSTSVNTNNNTTNSTVSSTVNSTNTNNNNNNTTSNNTNNNNNVNTSTSSNVNQNTNINQNTSDSNVTTENTNSNTNVNTSTSDNTNRNINESKSEQVITQNINQKAPPASAIAPSIMSYSQDLCTTGVSGAFQGQVFGLSGGKAVRDENCERLKLSKYLYDTGMKIAAVGVLCQDPRVFKAMHMAGTPCPYEGKIGEEAKTAWRQNPEDRPDYQEAKDRYVKRCRAEKTKVKKSRLTCVREFKNQT